MKFLTCFALSFLFVSCANLAADRWDEKEEEKTQTTKPEEPVAAPEAPDLPAEAPDDGLKFVDPNTTSELLNDENKKTVTGPAPVNVADPDADSAIDVQPTIPAPPEED